MTYDKLKDKVRHALNLKKNSICKTHVNSSHGIGGHFS